MTSRWDHGIGGDSRIRVARMILTRDFAAEVAIQTTEETFQTAEETFQTAEETFQTAEETWNHLGIAMEFYLDKN